MQLNFNPQQNNQHFGAIHSNEVVNRIIKNRIRNGAEMEKLEKIIHEASSNNYVDVNLMANPDRKTISANIYSTCRDVGGFFKSRSENFFSRVFGGGIVGFIEECSKIADKAAVKVRQAEQIANSEVFNKMK